MTFKSAQREFRIRYYLWAISEFESEIEESFPTLRLFKAGASWATYQFMQQLTRREQFALAHALLKRTHANTVQVLGETCSPEEELLRSRRDAFPSNILTFSAEIRARKNAGEQIKLASKRRLRKVITAQFKAAFGRECIGLACVDEEDDLRFKMKRSGWIVETSFFFGRSKALLSYNHKIVSEQTFPYRHGIIAMGMAGYISFNSYLGIASQTEWDYLSDEEVEPTCNTVIKLCGHFFDVLPKLLKGLECETVTPDEDYELSSSPLR
jgi:hypothetical protein